MTNGLRWPCREAGGSAFAAICCRPSTALVVMFLVICSAARGRQTKGLRCVQGLSSSFGKTPAQACNRAAVLFANHVHFRPRCAASA